MQQEKRALKKRHERIQQVCIDNLCAHLAELEYELSLVADSTCTSFLQIAASNILDMQAKHDTLQRKVAEATRLEDYEKVRF